MFVALLQSVFFFSTLINAKLMQNIGLTNNPFWVLLGFIIHVAFLKMLLEKDKTKQTNKKAPAQERHLRLKIHIT